MNLARIWTLGQAAPAWLPAVHIAYLTALTVGGLLSVTMYWGHEAGKTERAAVLRWAAALDRSTYHCVHTDMCNQPNCPPEILFVTRKKSRWSLSAQDSKESDGNGHAR